MVENLYLLRCLIPDYKPIEGRTFLHTIFCYNHEHPAIHTNLTDAWEFHDGSNQVFNNFFKFIYLCVRETGRERERRE